MSDGEKKLGTRVWSATHFCWDLAWTLTATVHTDWQYVIRWVGTGQHSPFTRGKSEDYEREREGPEPINRPRRTTGVGRCNRRGDSAETTLHDFASAPALAPTLLTLWDHPALYKRLLRSCDNAKSTDSKTNNARLHHHHCRPCCPPSRARSRPVEHDRLCSGICICCACSYSCRKRTDLACCR